MKYREQLEKVQALGISICELDIANECDCVFEFETTEQEFENLCEFANYIYLKSENLTPNAIAQCINEMITYSGKTVEEVTTMDKLDFMDEAVNFMN
nr:MAG TPA: hypothetical protein [Caudoviricetes sp.]